MAIHVLITIGWLLTFCYGLKCNLHILHFLPHGLLPECISILLIADKHLFDHLRQLMPKFMGPFKILKTAPFHHGNYYVSFVQDMITN